MKRNNFFYFFCMLQVLLVFAFLDCVSAWGSAGHAITGWLADELISSTASDFVEKVLSGKKLHEVASWADEIRHLPEFAWSSPLHFADMTEKDCKFDYQRDCLNDVCVVGAIRNYTTRLVSPTYSEEDLKFLVHFVGDAHQPLHVGFKEDRGGNDIHVNVEFCSASAECPKPHANLHATWDERFIEEWEHENNEQGWQSLASKILSDIKQGKYSNLMDLWLSCKTDLMSCPYTVASESASDACDLAYKNNQQSWIRPGDALRRQYYETRLDDVEGRLAAAGVRLATLIETISATNHPCASFLTEI